MTNVGDIEKAVDGLLRQTPLGRSLDLHVEEGATQVDGDWLYVLVAQRKPGGGAYEVAELLAVVEQDARARLKKAEILLVPVRVNASNGTH